MPETKRPRYTSDQLAEAVEAVKKHASLTDAARALGIARSTLSERYAEAKRQGEALDTDDEKREKWERAGDGASETITSVSRRLKTLDDVIEHAKIDLEVWEVERYVINKWEVGRRDKAVDLTFTNGTANGSVKDTGKVFVEPLFQVKVWLRRLVPQSMQDAIATLIGKMKVHSPKYAPIKRVVAKQPHLFEPSLFDAHFGKLAWKPETRSDYDLKIAESVYSTAIDTLLDRVRGYEIDRVLFPIGQDFFHIDNGENTTTAGTRQDVDGRLAKVFDVGCMAVVRAIDRLRTVAPVDVLHAPGNHDRHTSFYLAKFIEAWYRNDKSVTVDARPISRKYYSYGRNMIGTAHGDDEKHTDFPALMAIEEPAMFAESVCREMHCGHYHIKRERWFLQSDTHKGVVIRIIPSLSGSDAWHHRKGYIGHRAAEAHLFAKEGGHVGYFSASA